MADNKPICDIMVRDLTQKRKHGVVAYRLCGKTGRYYDKDDGKTRCTTCQKKHDRIVAGYLADMAATRATHPHLVN